MKVKKLVKLFDLFQHVEIYPHIPEGSNKDYFYILDLEQPFGMHPLYTGRLQDMPFWLGDCRIHDYSDEGESMIDVRTNKDQCYATLVFAVDDPEDD